MVMAQVSRPRDFAAKPPILGKHMFDLNADMQ